MDIDVVQLAIFGFCTGLGTTMGSEVVKIILQQVKERVKDGLNNGKPKPH